jgi:NAD(P)-dependent dehydrogenase (short-subunit alcohol dehydrogenase family)
VKTLHCRRRNPRIVKTASSLLNFAQNSSKGAYTSASACLRMFVQSVVAPVMMNAVFKAASVRARRANTVM